MKSVDAYWEKRNLGVTCTELSCEVNDDTATVLAAAAALANEYLVIKVPARRADLLLELQNLGFHVIEAVFRIRRDLHKLEPSPAYQRFVKDLTWHIATPPDLERIYEDVRAGVFQTDRCALDPAFAPGLAGQRYCNWIADALGRAGAAYVTSFKGEDIGFSVLEDCGQGRFHGLFGAMYRDNKHLALGFSVGWTNLVVAKERGGKNIETTVSTNNVPAVKMNLSIGYDIHEIQYVLVKHQAQR
jgi:hypothetical protein